MNQKLIDYEKVCKIIRSCRNSRHNTVAYVVIMNFAKKYGHDVYTMELYDLCDLNLSQCMGNHQ